MAAWLNHHHLEYFRRIAREGGVSAAARKLRVTHSTLSTQLRQLEGVLGAPLFEREGRRLVLTPFGEQVLTYAESIHRVGEQLLDFAQTRRAPQHRRPLRLAVSATLPRTIVYRLVEPLLKSPAYGPIEFRERPTAALAGELTSGRAHLALSDEPVVKPGVRSQLLGGSGLLWYGAREFGRLRERFPASLAGEPVVLPAGPLRKPLEQWLVDRDLTTARVVATADDAATLRTLGVRGVGVFPVRSALRAEVEDLHGPVPLGRVDGVTDRYYALTHDEGEPAEELRLVIGAARAGLRPQVG